MKTDRFFILCLIHSGAAILSGAVLYLIFRPDVYISEIVYQLFHIENRWEYGTGFLIDFMRYYLPDMLWAYAFPFALFSVIGMEKSAIPIVCVISAAMVVVSEVLQYMNVISGTGDIMDIVLEIIAAGLAIYYIKKAMEENNEKDI